jgi:type I restriction enzyme S subunit
LRFPEFQEEWKKYKISDILELFPTNSLSWEQLEYNTSNIYNLHYGLIHKGLPTQIELDKCALPNIKEEFIPNNYTLCENGDVAFADASEDTNDVAKVVEFYDCNNKNIVCGLHTIHGRDKLGLTITGFKGYVFSANVFRHQIKRLAQGTKIYSISTKNFNESYICITSKEEQKKISNLMYLIDQRIETQNKIIEKYESLIKGISHLLIDTQEPNVRLNDIVDCHSSTVTEAVVLGTQGSFPVYGAAGILAYTSRYEVDEDSVLIIKDGSGVGRIQYTTGKYSVLGTLNYLTVKSHASLKYIYYSLLTFNFDKFKVGSGIPHIYFKDYGNELIYCPNFVEQEKIANALSMIDHKILIEKNLLENYVKQKNYLFSNLFI